MRPRGAGLHTEVLLVWDEQRRIHGAAKVIRPRWEERRKDLVKLRREGEVLSLLEHPAFPRCLDVALEGPRPHLLLEVVEGRTLLDIVRERRPPRLRRGLPLDEVVPAFASLAEGIAHLAGHGWVHRDITPENVIAGEEWRIIDLGRAREAQTVARTDHTRSGSAFRPPEICEPGPARGPIGPPADVFALGGTLYFALTGRRPFPDRKRDRYVDGVKRPAAQLTVPPAPFRRPLPDPLRELVLAMLSVDATRRPTAADVAERLRAMAGPGKRRATLSRSLLRTSNTTSGT